MLVAHDDPTKMRRDMTAANFNATPYVCDDAFALVTEKYYKIMKDIIEATILRPPYQKTGAKITVRRKPLHNSFNLRDEALASIRHNYAKFKTDRLLERLAHFRSKTCAEMEG